ncbi:unnamed protein product [Mesocestoides corti]|uniref:Uncharacterized protein n=1 Tax=Mesocestoides corti TaxID=53468 RepID=A0A0R3UHB5_MESCO|nr:unnamed protein product [Mesocestoides corti]
MSYWSLQSTIVLLDPNGKHGYGVPRRCSESSRFKLPPVLFFAGVGDSLQRKTTPLRMRAEEAQSARKPANNRQ